MQNLYQPFNPYKMFHGSFIPEWLESRSIKECSVGAKLIYARLTRYAGKDGKCYPPVQEIASATGYKKRQVENILKELKALKLIKAIRVGKKCTNRYVFLWHPWIAEAIEIHSDTQNSADNKNSDTQNSADPMDTQNSADPYKENQERESNNIRDFSKKFGKAKINEQIKEIYQHWKKEINKPNWGLIDERYKAIKNALVTGVVYRDDQTLEKYEEPLTVEQIKELITLHANDPWWIKENRLDLPSMLTKRRMAEYVSGFMKRTTSSNNTQDNKNLTVLEI